jgi:hypothetical protein
MAIYKLTSSVVVNLACGTVLTAGQTVTDSGPAAQLPPNYVPNGCCDPQDIDGLNKVFAAGPIAPTIDPFVPPPVTYWRYVLGSFNPRLWGLTGLGAALPSKPGS